MNNIEWMNKLDILSLNTYLYNVNLLLKRKFYDKYYKQSNNDTLTIISSADPKKDYYFEQSFKDYAFRIDWKYTNTGCDGSVCFPYYRPKKICLPNDKTVMLNKDIAACQPSCYGTYVKSSRINPIYGKWVNGKCINYNAETIAFFLDPELRPDPTGRDNYSMHITFPNDTREFSIKIDEEYCNQFGMVLENHKCSVTNTSPGYFVSFFIGDSMIKLFKLGYNYTSSVMYDLLVTRRADYKYSDTIPVPNYYTRRAKNDKLKLVTDKNVYDNTVGFVNKSIIIPSLYKHFGISSDDIRFVNGKPVKSTIMIDTRTFDTVNADNMLHSIYSAENETDKQHNPIYATDGGKIRNVIDNTMMGIESNANMIMGTIAMDYAIQSTLKHVKNFRSIIENSPKHIIELLEKNSKIKNVILSHAMNYMIRDRVIVETGKMIALSTRLSISAISVVGLLSVVGPLFDVFWELCWDPFKLTINPLDDETISKIINRAASSSWKTEPLEITPEYMWDNYYGVDIDNLAEVTYTNVVAVSIYIQHRTISWDGTIYNDTTHLNDIKQYYMNSKANSLLYNNVDELDRLRKFIPKAILLFTGLQFNSLFNFNYLFIIIIMYALITLYIYFITINKLNIYTNNNYNKFKYII